MIARLCIDVRPRKRAKPCNDAADAADRGGTPGQLPAPREQALAVRRAIASLPARHRAAILLRHETDLSYDETGAILGVSAMAVDSLLQRARPSLRALLKDVL